MTIEKRIFNDAYDWVDSPSGVIVPVGQRGVDVGFRKQAANNPFAERLATLRPMKKHAVQHNIAMGDEERFSANRNCDAFSRQDCIDKHHTFVKTAHVFKNHKNTHPDLAIGKVIDSAHNDDQGRVELLLAVDEDKGGGLLDKLEKTGQLGASMGSLQHHDTCSYCKHEAKTAAEHCSHLKNFLGEVTEDGKRIYMQNPDPNFFDISLLDVKPADRIGWTLKKVANSIDARVVGGHELPELCGLTHETAKLATLNKLSEMEKRIPGIAQKATPANLSARTKSQLVKQASKYGTAALLQELANNRWLLSPQDFGEVIAGMSQKQASAFQSRPFSEIQEDPIDIGSLDPQPGLPMDLGRDCQLELDSTCKLAHASVVSRVMRNSIVLPQRKTASYEVDGLSQLYTYYKLAFATYHRHDTQLLQSVVAC